jgi:hypothetical protein
MVPIVNEVIALLLDAGAALSDGMAPRFALDDMIAPPAVVLSHDCDVLNGNDYITQAIRIYRIFQPLGRGRLPKFGLLPTIAENFLDPHRYYLKNLLAMMEVEQRFGFRSVLYILNGTGGRFGARSDHRSYSALIEGTPTGWEVGIHYNYDTFDSPKRFGAQLDEIQSLSGQLVISGRAHYLRFDPLVSPSFVSNRGVQFDESVGWTGQNGYRAGIAAPFFPLDPATGNPLPLIELPLMFMDANLSDGADGFAVFSEMFTHLKKIGGVLSLLFHPGTFANPEKPALTGLYARVLQHLRENGARNYLPRDIVRIAGDLRSGRLLPTEMMTGRLGR